MRVLYEAPFVSKLRFWEMGVQNGRYLLNVDVPDLYLVHLGDI